MVDLNIHLPQSFFLEEERDGYLVSAEMKSLWAVQLDLLCEFDRVCRKYGIKYILDFGTLLGAVRHKGYIPWDDDIDVSMLREDYDKLLSVASQEFKEPYFLQNQLTDNGYDDYVPKLRRSDTACLMKYNIGNKCRCNLGIFIDIFVFDNIPTSDLSKEKMLSYGQKSRDIYYHVFTMANRPGFSFSINYLARMSRYLIFKMRYGSVRKEYMRLEKLATCHDYSDYVANITYLNPRYRPRSWYEKRVEIAFEEIKFQAPEAYDDLLKECFGDYMTPVKGGNVHTMIYYSTERSYKDIVTDKILYKKLCDEYANPVSGIKEYWKFINYYFIRPIKRLIPKS